ncbi:MAG TPA: hypothetical protein DDW52_16250 [Planctomycetaceae bacterium]|nr:hypothetical protein [Planctomycetaceae bacterium]
MNAELLEEWGVLAIYWAVALLCWLQVRNCAATTHYGSIANRATEFWFVLCAALFAMGVNKAGDFQTPFIESLKTIGKSFGGAQHQTTLRVALVTAITAVSLALVGYAVHRYREQFTTRLALTVGLAGLGLFYAMRMVCIVGNIAKRNYWTNGPALEILSLVLIGVAIVRISQTNQTDASD